MLASSNRSDTCRRFDVGKRFLEDLKFIFMQPLDTDHDYSVRSTMKCLVGSTHRRKARRAYLRCLGWFLRPRGWPRGSLLSVVCCQTRREGVLPGISSQIGIGLCDVVDAQSFGMVLS